MKNIHILKTFIDEKIEPVERLKRPGNDSISNELLQMIKCSLDSHIVTFLNISHFNARRKSTLTCEQLFGTITLMADGGRKLDCRQISDILERCMISNALRMTPESVKGFKFLSKMKVHMKSYRAEPEQDKDEASKKIEYPSLTQQKHVIIPSDSVQDMQSLKRKRALSVPEKTESLGAVLRGSTSDVRQYHKKFK